MAKAQSYPNIPVGLGWHDLTGTNLQVSQGVDTTPAHCPANNFGGFGYNYPAHCHAVYDAWGSGALDDDDEYLLIYGGGHSDYSGDEVYALKYGQANPALVRLTDPLAPSGNSYGYIPDAATCNQGTTSPTCGPNSVHSYNNLTYAPNTKEMFLDGGAVAFSGSRAVSAWTFGLIPTSPFWTRRDACGHGVQGDTGSCTGSQYPLSNTDEGVITYDPVNQLVYMWFGQACEFWSYNSSTHAFTRLSTINCDTGSASDGAGTVDPDNHIQVTITSSKIWSIGLSSPYTLSDHTSACSSALGSWSGVAYDPIDKKVIIFPASAGTTIYILDTTAWSCTTETYSGGPANPHTGDIDYQGLSGRFQYSAKEDAFITCAGPYQDCFALRRRLNPLSDFNNRCARSGVLNCRAWDASGDFVHASGGGGYASGIYPGSDTLYHAVQDTVIRSSGASSLKFITPAGSVVPLNSNNSGYFLQQFGTDGSPYNVTQGKDIYFQFRMYLSSSALQQSTWNAVSNGWKVFIVWGPIPGASCTGDQFVLENTGMNNILDEYGSCSAPGIYGYKNGNPNSSPDGNLEFEQGDFPNCTYQIDAANCFQYTANTWIWIYEHIHVGTWGSNNSTFEAWAANQGGTAQQFLKLEGTCCYDGSAFWGDGTMPGNGMNGIELLTYFTGVGSSTTTPEMDMNIDELIISTQCIPTPFGIGQGSSPSCGSSPPPPSPPINLTATPGGE